MNPDGNSHEQLAQLQKEHQRLAFSVHLLAAALIVGLTFGCLLVLWLVPRFKEVLAGMVEGSPLPALTIIVFDSVVVLGLATLSIAATGLAIIFATRRTSTSFLLAMATALALLIQLLAIIAACLLPLIDLFSHAGNGPQ